MYFIDERGIYLWEDGYYNDSRKRYVVEVGYGHTSRQLDAFISMVEEEGTKKYQRKLKNQFRELKGLLSD